jgi:hypothetical protein
MFRNAHFKMSGTDGQKNIKKSLNNQSGIWILNLKYPRKNYLQEHEQILD